MFRVDDPELLLALHALYQFEAERTSGPHGGAPGFRPWSAEEVVAETSIDGGLLSRLIEFLRTEEQILFIPAYGDFPERYATRSAEMVRTLGTLHDYVQRKSDPDSDERQHLQIIEATKWVPALLERPDREVSISQVIQTFADELDAVGIRVVRGQPVAQVLTLVRYALLAIAQSTLDSYETEGFLLTKFQDRAIRKALMSSFYEEGDDHTMVVAAGTGSGKTIAFTVPVLVDAVLDTLHERPFSGARWTQLLIYPRNDLAFDQFATLEDYCARLNLLLAQDEAFGNTNLCIALDADGHISNKREYVPAPPHHPQGQWDRHHWDSPRKPNVVAASASRYGGVDPHQRTQAYRPANIIIASSESFRRRLMIPEVCRAVKESLQRVVLDEIHLAEGTNGGHLRGLFNRIKQMARPRKLQFIGASATIASPEQHVEAVWGEDAQRVHLATPSEHESNGAPGGIANHVLVRPRSGVTKGGPVYNSTSLVGHQSKNENWFEERAQGEANPKNLDKMICFADSREFVTRWQMLLNENEVTDHSHRIRAQQVTGDGRGGAVRLPYAHWFDRPLAQQCHGGAEVCKACKKGEKVDQNILMRKEEVQEFWTRVGGRAVAEVFAMDTLKGLPDELSVNSLDECPHLVAGTCWHFAPGTGVKALQPSNGRISPSQIRDALTDRPGQEQGMLVFKNSLRARRHTADSRKDGSDDGLSRRDFSADELYVHQSGEAYPGDGPHTPRGPQIPHDVIVATPTLEVGVDMKNVSNIMTHRAMRNIASYRQKAGRAGREKNSVTNTVTVLSLRPADYQFYKNEDKLVLDRLLEPVPVANNNRMVMRSQAYMAVLDWLALQSINIEEIQSKTLVWKDELSRAADALTHRREDALGYLNQTFRTGVGASVLEAADLHRAIEVFETHLDLLRNGTYTPANTTEEISVLDEFLRVIGDRENRAAKILPPSSKENTLEEDLRSVSDGRRDCTDFFDTTLLARIDSLNQLVYEESSSAVAAIDGILSELPSTPTANRMQRRNLNALTLHLNELKMTLEDDKSDAVRPRSEQLAEDIYRIRGSTPKYYFSWLLSECSVFLDDAPYCFIERVFENPHERPIHVKITGDSYSRTQSMHQFMRDMLPGTWNHRLIKTGSGHALKSPVGGSGLQLLGNDDLQRFATVLRQGSQERADGIYGQALRVKSVGESFDTASIPQILNMGLEQAPVDIIRPKFLELAHETGVLTEGNNTPTDVWCSPSSPMVALMDRPRGPDDVARKIPEAYPIGWTSARMPSDSPLLAYSPSWRKAPPGEAGRHPVTTHPLLHRLFSGIEFSTMTSIKDVVVGVQRTGGLTIRYKVDRGEDAVFGQVFNTHGIQHTVSPVLLIEFDESVEAYASRPFDVDALHLLAHHFERITFATTSQRFTVRDLINVLVLSLYVEDSEAFPSTLGEALQHWSTGVSDEVRETYLSSLHDNERENVRTTLEPMLSDFNLRCTEIFAEDELKASLREWGRYTLLNTLGQLLVTSGSSYAGVEEGKLAFAIDVERCSITLYDDDAEGNGACELIHRYYQISEATRAASGEMRAPPLPSEDFVSILEDQFLTCEEHIANRAAFELAQGSPLPERRLKHELRAQATSLNDRYQVLWNQLSIRSVQRSSLLFRIAPSIRQELQVEDPLLSNDLLEQALHTCSTGCFVCSGTAVASAFPLNIASRYTSRALVDQLVGFGEHLEGYENGANRRRFSVSRSREEVYPHWHWDNDQDVVIPFTLVPKQIGYFTERGQGPLGFIRLVRLVDHLEVES
jgi:hypothetical protein